MKQMMHCRSDTMTVSRTAAILWGKYQMSCRLQSVDLIQAGVPVFECETGYPIFHSSWLFLGKRSRMIGMGQNIWGQDLNATVSTLPGSVEFRH